MSAADASELSSVPPRKSQGEVSDSPPQSTARTTTATTAAVAATTRRLRSAVVADGRASTIARIEPTSSSPARENVPKYASPALPSLRARSHAVTNEATARIVNVPASTRRRRAIRASPATSRGNRR